MRNQGFRSSLILALACVTTAASGGTAAASTVTYMTPTGSTNAGQPVDATAMFTTSTDQITVVLNNLIVNPTAVSQNISDLLFTVSTGQTAGSIASSSGLSRTVNGDGTYTDNGMISASHWAYQVSGSQIYLNDLSGGQPKQTIIGSPDGSNNYSNANSGIAGNGPHNPFLYGPVTFTLDVLGVTAASTITAATFSFGTGPGQNVPGVAVPEPASSTLIAIGLVSLSGVGAVRRRLARSRCA